MSQGLLIIDALQLHTDTPHSVGLLWTCYQSDADTSTWKYIRITRDRHPCPRRDSNPATSERSKTHALDDAASGIGTHCLVRTWNLVCHVRGKVGLDDDEEQLIEMNIEAQVEWSSRTMQKITQCGPSYFAFFFNWTLHNEAAAIETKYTVFRVECLSYNEEFWKWCKTKWRCSVTEVNGEKQETPQLWYFASGPRFDLSTFQITTRSVVDGTNVPGVMPCAVW